MEQEKRMEVESEQQKTQEEGDRDIRNNMASENLKVSQFQPDLSTKLFEDQSEQATFYSLFKGREPQLKESNLHHSRNLFQTKINTNSSGNLVFSANSACVTPGDAVFNIGQSKSVKQQQQRRTQAGNSASKAIMHNKIPFRKTPAKNNGMDNTLKPFPTGNNSNNGIKKLPIKATGVQTQTRTDKFTTAIDGPNNRGVWQK